MRAEALFVGYDPTLRGDSVIAGCQQSCSDPQPKESAYGPD